MREFRLIPEENQINIGLIIGRQKDDTLFVCSANNFEIYWSDLEKIKTADYVRKYIYSPGIHIPKKFKIDNFVLFKYIYSGNESLIYWIEEISSKAILRYYHNISCISTIFKSNRKLPEYFENARIEFYSQLSKYISSNLVIINLTDYLDYIEYTISQGRIIYRESRHSRYSDFGYDSWSILCSSYNFERQMIKSSKKIEWYEEKTMTDEYLNSIMPKREYYILKEAAREEPALHNFDLIDIEFFKIHGEKVLEYFGIGLEKNEINCGSKTNILIDHWTNRDGQYNKNDHKLYIVNKLNEFILNLWPNIFRDNLSNSLKIKMPNGKLFDLIIKL
jgi:hypothetical protein